MPTNNLQDMVPEGSRATNKQLHSEPTRSRSCDPVASSGLSAYAQSIAQGPALNLSRNSLRVWKMDVGKQVKRGVPSLPKSRT